MCLETMVPVLGHVMHTGACCAAFMHCVLAPASCSMVTSLLPSGVWVATGWGQKHRNDTRTGHLLSSITTNHRHCDTCRCTLTLQSCMWVLLQRPNHVDERSVFATGFLHGKHMVGSGGTNTVVRGCSTCVSHHRFEVLKAPAMNSTDSRQALCHMNPPMHF